VPAGAAKGRLRCGAHRLATDIDVKNPRLALISPASPDVCWGLARPVLQARPADSRAASDSAGARQAAVGDVLRGRSRRQLPRCAAACTGEPPRCQHPAEKPTGAVACAVSPETSLSPGTSRPRPRSRLEGDRMARRGGVRLPGVSTAPRCRAAACGKSASFGTPGGSATFCKAHRSCGAPPPSGASFRPASPEHELIRMHLSQARGGQGRAAPAVPAPDRLRDAAHLRRPQGRGAAPMQRAPPPGGPLPTEVQSRPQPRGVEAGKRVK